MFTFASQSKLSKISFFVYLFFVFFGTSLPFSDRITDVQDIVTSNPVKQFVFPFLYIFSLLALFPKREGIIEFIKQEKFLTIFLFWTLLSILWSADPFVSFIRWFQILGTVIIFLSALLQFSSPDDAIPYFKSILHIYLPITILSILLVPGAIQWEFPAWRGIATQKNALGRVGLISLIFWTKLLLTSGERKTIASFFWLSSCIILIGSKSVTSIFTCCVLAFMAGLWRVEKAILRPFAGRLISSLLVLSFLLSALLLVYSAPGILTDSFEKFGKDTTFTGRVKLWELVLEETKKHLFWGSGFEGFWVTNLPYMQEFSSELYWIPGSAHQGYLEILNETGIVGLCIFLLLLISYFRNLVILGKTHFWKWFVFAALILNITESTLFRLHSPTGVLFTFSYIALNVELCQQRETSGLPLPTLI